MRFDRFIILCNELKLFLFQGCPGITIFTATALAFAKIAYEFFFDHLITYQYVINYQHRAKIQFKVPAFLIYGKFFA